MNILVSGATGLVGKHLCNHLRNEGHQVKILSRSVEKGQKAGFETVPWQPETELPSPRAFADVEAIVHLAGEPIAARRWDAEQKRRIRDSRVLSTRNLVASLKSLDVRPKVFVCASAVGFYGNRGEEILTEQSRAGTGFLSEVCQQWEAEAAAASQLDIRVVHIRIGVVVASDGSALQSMLPIFQFGLGGALGTGQQWFPWVHLDDVVGIIKHAIYRENVNGAVNCVAPGIVRNEEFTWQLAKQLHRPAFLSVPSFALRVLLGEMADLLLMSSRIIPEVAIKSGYDFKFPSLDNALNDVLSVS